MKWTTFWIMFSFPFLLAVNSCSAPQVRNQERCFADFQFHYGTKAQRQAFFNQLDRYKDDPEMREKFLEDVLSIFGRGRCIWYNLNEVRPSSNDEGRDVPLVELDTFGGFSFDAWATQITPWGRELRQWGKDTCN